MKKLIIFLLTFVCFLQTYAQNPVTATTVKADRLTPRTTTGLRITNADFTYVNDTLLRIWVKSNATSSSDSSFNEVDIHNELRIGSTQQLNLYGWSFRNFDNTLGTDIDSTGISYLTHQTNQNNNWIPDKFYVDSVVNNQIVETSLDTTRINYSDGLPDSLYQINIDTSIYSTVEIDLYYIDSISNNGSELNIYVNRNINYLGNFGDAILAHTTTSVKENTHINIIFKKIGNNWLMFPSNTTTMVLTQPNHIFNKPQFIRLSFTQTGLTNYIKSMFYTIKRY